VRAVFEKHEYIIDFEYMDTKALPFEENTDQFANYLSYKLDHKPHYDLLLAFDDNAVHFAENHQEDLFSGIPIIFAGVNDLEYGRQLSKNPMITGVIEDISIEETIDSILLLQNDIEKLYLLVDNTPSGQADLQRVLSVDLPMDVEVINCSELPRETFLDQVGAINPKDAIIPISIYKGYDNRYYDFYESLEGVIRVAKAPVYHFWQHGMGEGIVGGKLNSHYEQAVVASNMGLSILRGRDPSQIALVEESPNKFIYDYTVMEAHQLAMDQLPEGTEILNRPLKFSEANPMLFLKIVIAFAILILTIALLLVSLYYRSSRAVELEKANIFLGKVLNAIQYPIAIKDSKMQYVMCNTPFLDLSERPIEGVLGKCPDNLFKGDILDQLKSLDEALLVSEEAEGEITFNLGGQTQVMRVKKRSFRDEDDHVFYISSGFDITNIKEYENDLERLVHERTEALEEANYNLEKLTVIDQLTQVYNRRKLDEILIAEMDRYKRYDEPFSVIMADIDHFKLVNDEFGHLVGDETIKKVATIFIDHVRSLDAVGRWGGEEFLVICIGSDSLGAEQCAEKLRRLISEADMVEGRGVTCSFGVSTVKPNQSINSLVKAADDALYQAKRDGRNLVRVAK
jgi:diguanylate cyclase (GGDEF)-like protein